MAGRKRHSNAALKPLTRERDKLIEQWGRLTEQAEAVSNKIQGLELAISIIHKGDAGIADETDDEAKPATHVKALLLDLAREVKADGLNANIAVKLAADQGVHLKRGTAASNLSRLKTDKALVHDGHRYRLPEFARKQIGLTIIDETSGVTTLSLPVRFSELGTVRSKGS